MVRSAKRFGGRGSSPNVFLHRKGVPTGLLYQYVLRRIAEKPVHGYELLRQIETRTKGAWKPSAGSIYPILKELLSEKYIQAESRKMGGRTQRVYRITRNGTKYLQQHTDMILKAEKKYGAMRPILMELIPPQHVPRLFGPMVAGQLDFVKGIVESKRDKIPPKETKSMLKDYVLALQGQLEWARRMLRQLR